MLKKKIGYQTKPSKISEGKKINVGKLRESVSKINEASGFNVVSNKAADNGADVTRIAADMKTKITNPNAENVTIPVNGTTKPNQGFNITPQDSGNTQDAVQAAQSMGADVQVSLKNEKKYTKKDIVEMRLKNMRENSRTISKGMLREMMLGKF